MEADHEAFERIRRRLEHEDNLMNQRLSWILKIVWSLNVRGTLANEY
jgi:hypothetical protein